MHRIFMNLADLIPLLFVRRIGASLRDLGNAASALAQFRKRAEKHAEKWFRPSRRCC